MKGQEAQIQVHIVLVSPGLPVLGKVLQGHLQITDRDRPFQRSQKSSPLLVFGNVEI